MIAGLKKRSCKGLCQFKLYSHNLTNFEQSSIVLLFARLKNRKRLCEELLNSSCLSLTLNLKIYTTAVELLKKITPPFR